MTDEQRVKEVYPEAHIEIETWCGYHIVSGVNRLSMECASEAEAWADAASRLPKAEEETRVRRAAFCPRCGMNIHNETAGVSECPVCHGEVLAPLAAEPAPQTFEWMLSAAQEINRIQLNRDHVIKDSFGLKHPIMPVDEQVAIMKKHWNAAKASSPAVAGGESDQQALELLRAFVNSLKSGRRSLRVDHDELSALVEETNKFLQDSLIKDVRGKE